MTFLKTHRRAIRRGLIITAVLACLAFLGFVLTGAFYKEAARDYQQNNAPAAGSDREHELKQDAMEREVYITPIGKQFDLMLEARKQGADMGTTAGLRWGRNLDAPLVNYIYREWSYEKRLGDERLDRLLDKIAREGRPTLGQLSHYQKLAINCDYTYGEQDPQADCRAFDEAIACKGHCVANEGGFLAEGYDQCLVIGDRVSVQTCKPNKENSHD